MKNVILILCFAFSFLTYSQLIAQYQFTTFDESAGLPDQSCRGMAVDSTGTLWVGTQEGVAKWDGTSFVHVPIADSVLTPFVNVIKVAPDGNIWVGYLTLANNLGLSVIDTDGNLILHADNELSGQSGTWVYDIEFGPDGLVYVAHDFGISTYDGVEWELEVPSSSNFAATPVKDLLFAEDGSLWVGTFFGLAHRQTNGSWENFYTLSTDLIGNNIRSLAFDNEDKLWIGTSQGLSIYDSENFENYELNEGLPNSIIQDIAFDAAGRAWLMTNDGFSIFDGMEFQNFKTHESNFIENRISDILISPELGTWMTTREGMVLVEDVVSSTRDKYFNNATQLQVYPNPTEGPVHLLLEEGVLQVISVISSHGQLLQQYEFGEDLRETSLDLSLLSSGIYWLHIETSEGLLIRKIVRY